VGAILTQNTAWGNVEKAIRNLIAAEAMNPAAIVSMKAVRLERLIRPTGYFRQKAKKLKIFSRWILAEFGGDLRRMKRTSLPELRERLLSVWGIGPETADSILLYAVQHPSFVVDAYTYRVTVRHGWVDPEANYETLREEFARELPNDVDHMGELHALLVRVGKERCRPREPRCEGCALQSLLPSSGPRPLGE
jgi:endonuclease-3 related protein